MRKINILYISMVIIFYFACKGDSESISQAKTSEESGELIESEKGIIIRRDYYLLDSISLSIFYTKDGKNAIYCQCFSHDTLIKQIIFDQKAFKEETFDLYSNDKSDAQKGLKLYRYYCGSCHSGISRDINLKSFNQSADDLYRKINSSNHPTKFNDLDSLEMECLRRYISQEN